MTIAKILTTIFVIVGWCIIAFEMGKRIGKEEKMKQPVFDRKKHRYAKLQDGTVEPLYYGDGKGGLDLSEPRNFYKAEFGRWYLDFDRYYGASASICCLMHLRIVEFLEDVK